MTTYAPSGSEFVVNSTYSRSQAQSDGVQLADGNSIIVWVDADFNTTANRFIRAQIYQHDGTPVGAELTLVAGSAFINPAVAALADGGFVVTWEGLTTIRAQVFDQSGAATAPAFDVSPSGASSVDRPDVAALADGGFAVSWHDSRTAGGDSSGSAVHLRTFTATGAPTNIDTLVNTSTAGNQADSSIAALSDGNFVVTWTDRGAPGSGASWLIKGRIVDSAGAPIGAEFVVNSSTAGVSSVESSVTPLANGTFAVAWYESDPTLGSGHRIQLFSPSGVSIGAQITVPPNLSGTQVGPKLIGLADGGLAIAWTANSAPQSDGSGKSVFVQVFDANGQPTADPMLVNSQTNGDQFDPALVALAGGGFVVSWTDLNGAGADDDQVKAQVFTPQQPVAIISDGGGDSATVAAAENQLAVTQVSATVGGSGADITYAIDGGDDSALFAIDQMTGMLSFVMAPDFEAPGSDGNNLYVVRVRASSGDYSDSQTLSVAVTNVNEAPVITSDGGGTSAALLLAENGTAVTTVTASDGDSQTVQYAIVGGNDASLFTIDPESGVLAFVAAPDFEAPADFAADNFYTVTVSASDGEMSVAQSVEILVTNVNEGVTVTSSGGGDAAALSANENGLAATTVTATDLDGDSLTYAIGGGADASKFTIDPVTGALAFVAAPDFEAPGDADANNIYDVLVQATDGSFTDAQALAIAIANVNDAPIIGSNGGGDAATVLVTENTTAVTIVAAADPEGTARTYSITGGADAARFTINAVTGALSFVTAPDFEVRADANGDNLYEVVVAASDGALLDTQSLSVGIANIVDGQTLNGTASADTLTGGAAEDTINGQAGNDKLNGMGGADVINGGNGTDTLSGGDGDDRLNGGAGNDLLVGGNGDDLFEVGSFGGVDGVEGGAGFDRIVATANGVTIGLSSLSGIESISANGHSAVKITGSSSDDALDFTGVRLSGIVDINGGSGDDTIYGSASDDQILGSGGADSARGGGGNDVLTGGAGGDRLEGGTGADLFVYLAAGDSKGTALDTIIDFQGPQGDRIDLSAIDANSKVSGDQAFAWIGSSAFHKVAGELREAIGSDGNIHVYADSTGDGKADFELILVGNATHTGADFIL